jgi:predicted acetyltransferase
VLEIRRLEERDQAAFARALVYEPSGDEHRIAQRGAAGMGFDAYLAKLRDAERGVGLLPGYVPATLFFGFADGEIVGRVSVRHELNDALRLIAGHIGYVVVPPMRRRGHGTAMLRHALDYARERRLREVLLTCDEDNAPSRRMIEHAGGVFESLGEPPDGGVRKRRYLIAL